MWAPCSHVASLLHSLFIAFVVLELSAAPSGPASTQGEQAFVEAKASLAKVRNDKALRKYRHHWLSAASKLERFVDKHPSSNRADDAEALLAFAYQQLYQFSGKPEDLARSKAHLRRARGAVASLVAEPTGLRAAPVKRPAVASARTPAPTRTMMAALAKVGRLPQGEERDDEGLESGEGTQAPQVPAVESSDAVDETAAAAVVPSLTELQERLRDVRIGTPEPTVDDSVAKQRLARVAKHDAHGELTLAAQLGLKTRRVVIDPGHGGHDTGAIGPSGVREKDVALGIARKLKDRLEAEGLEVLLTRDDDSFVKLEDRSKAANLARGDLFISVHCNAGPRKAMRGVETYTLNTSADRYAIRLAARENSTSERGVSDLQFILADLATKSNTEESARLAERVQAAMVKTLAPRNKGLKNLGHKEALFHVLLGARMPAILVETSFLSNPDEEKLLSSDGYQNDVARAISTAVTGFVEDRSRLATMD